MPLLIVEGPDGAGKSTLVDRIAALEQVDAVIHHGTYTELDSYELFATYMEALIRARMEYIVLDRCWLSERVYGAVVRRHDRFTEAQYRMLDRAAFGASATYIMCTPKHAFAFGNWQRRYAAGNEYITDPTVFNQIFYRYQHEHHELISRGFSVISYDPENHHEGVLWNDIIYALSNTYNRGPGAGNFRKGNTLIVGDGVNLNFGHQGWPFITGTKLGCSHWLAEQLETWQIPEHELYWINADDITWPDNGDPPTWLVALDPAKVICLGQKAAKVMARHWSGCTTVPHPQHHKRFHASYPYLLQETLQ